MGSFGRWSAYGAIGRSIKCTFFLVSLVAIAFSICCISYASWLLITHAQYAELLSPSLYVDVARILLIVSVIAIVNHLISVYTLCKELRCGVYSSAIASVVIFVMLFIGGIMGFVFRYQLINYIPLNLKMITSLRELYGTHDMEKITNAWDQLQSNFKCCGVNGTDDFHVWRTTKWFMHEKNETGEKQQLPSSCCFPSRVKDCLAVNLSSDAPIPPGLIYTDTCYEIFLNDLLHVMGVAAWLSIANSVVQIIPCAMSSWYARLIKK